MKQADRNDDLSALLRENLLKTTRCGGHVCVVTSRKGESVRLSASVERADGWLNLTARNLKSGWKVDSNTTGYEGDPVAVLRQMFEEKA